jgi:hypothetical protein
MVAMTISAPTLSFFPLGDLKALSDGGTNS